MGKMSELAIEQEEKQRIENIKFRKMMDDLKLITIPKEKFKNLLRQAYCRLDNNQHAYIRFISFEKWYKQNKISEL